MKNMGLPLALFIVCSSTAICIFSWFLLYTILEDREKHVIKKTDPCQFETLQEGMKAVGCDPVKIKDIGDGGWHIPDDWDEFELHDSKGNIKYYKRNDDGILKQVLK